MNAGTLVIMAGGAFAFVAAWRLVASGRVSIWAAMTTVAGVAGVAAMATGRVPLSPKVRWPVSAGAGAGAGVALYLATATFVLVVRRWPAFDRHVAEIYDQRRGLSVASALLLASGINAPGEELFWRGLFQTRLAPAMGWAGAALATWAAYLVVNLASENLPIVAGGIVGGAVWGALGLWTHGALASLMCHVVWTGLMLVRPPGGTVAMSAPPRLGPAREAAPR
jgi:membrane protease YdiL (CAAX protease family)